MQNIETERNALLEVRNLSKYFKLGRKTIIKAVDNVSFCIKKGETLGLVGESGCGKTTCGRTCIGLYEKTEGEVLYEGNEIERLHGTEKKKFNKKVQMIFQDPYTSLDPKMKVNGLISEGLRIHGMVKNKKEELAKVQELLHKVGLHPDYAYRYIQDFSGGQRQRIGIARALAVEPDFLLCDEPISALDVSIQAQIMNLLMELQEKMSLTYLFIAHDLTIVKHFANQVAVMYLGKLVEIGAVDEIYNNPLHPYTKALLAAAPIPDPDLERNRTKILLLGEGRIDIAKEQCPFAPRCPYTSPKCKEKNPTIRIVDTNHEVACHLFAK